MQITSQSTIFDFDPTADELTALGLTGATREQYHRHPDNGGANAGLIRLLDLGRLFDDRSDGSAAEQVNAILQRDHAAALASMFNE